MSDVVKTIELDNGKKVEFYPSDSNSRDWDNLTKIICFHGSYNLGDKNDYNQNDYDSWSELKKAIIKNEDVAIIKPLYLYDHSGITISTEPFSCGWDSGQVGFVIVTKKAIRENWSIKNVTQKYRTHAEKILDGEIETYDKELCGDVYGFVTYDKNGDLVDSCGGFYGDNFEENGMLEHIADEEIVEHLKKEKNIF